MTTATTAALQSIPLTELHESPLNPRKHYDEVALKQLAESFLASGQITPITVRPSKNGKGGYEIAAGHRRTRAAAQAGLTHLEAKVREDLVDDKLFIEVLNVENLQRDDLHPMEEAAGFRTLMEKAGYDIPKIAARIGKSTKYVYDRLKLLQLIKPAQQLFAENQLTAGHAILLARLSPKDQERAIGENDGRWGKIAGLFTAEYADEDSGELDLPGEGRKPVSVREFQAWINDHVRFIPEKEDLPALFPETGLALVAAKEEELKVVKITRDYRVTDEAKDPKERTYGEASWKRADGQSEPGRFSGKAAPAKACDYAVMGVVVAGPGRGEAFKVCINKDKCTVHWATEQREKARRAKSPGSSGNGAANYAERDKVQQEKYRKEQEQRKAELARWNKAAPQLLAALAAKLKTLPAGVDGVLGKLVLQRFAPYVPKEAAALAPSGKTADDLVRRLIYVDTADDILDDWRAQQHVPAAFKALGLDALKIVNQAAPKEKPAKAAGDTPVKVKKTGKLAGDVKRATKKAKAAK